MSVEEKLVHRIASVGPSGIKKTDLRRELGEIDTLLQNLVVKGDIFIEKRANAYFCFHKSHYVQSVVNSDARFRLTYEMIKSLEESVSSSSQDLLAAVETLANNVSNLARVVFEMKKDQQLWLSQKILTGDEALTNLQNETLSLEEFKERFDIALSNASSSIGWIELADIRGKICGSCNISSDEFYRLVGELISMDREKYELSTGGREGIMVRGLLHGFVRCI
ncbi:MAG: hypothetical protein M3270_07430 [Thermoproteota archaeon]|nr:hypothetical protein [Thermoproteota archaeon]